MPLTNTQYDEIMRVYQKRRFDRQDLIEARRAKLNEQLPGLKELDDKIAACSVQRARQLLDGDSSALEKLHRQIETLSEQKKDLLQEHGYPADYLSPPYTCPDCKDTGYIGRTRCHCLRQASIDLIYTQSNLRSILREENFSAFSYAYYADDLIDPNTQISALNAAKNAVSQCHAFIDRFDESFENILLFGDTGVGKTFLSHCVARELLDSGHSVIYFTAHGLFEALAQQTIVRDERAAADYRNIFDCDLLIIDDLGTELTNSFTTSQFFVCLNERIRRQKSTLISTNLELMDLASIYSERIFSRISNDFILLHLFGDDIRLQKQLGRRP